MSIYTLVSKIISHQFYHLREGYAQQSKNAVEKENIKGYAQLADLYDALIVTIQQHQEENK